jgi:hypothetical protein
VIDRRVLSYGGVLLAEYFAAWEDCRFEEPEFPVEFLVT